MKTLLFDPRSGVESKLCFVLMPFNPVLTNVYDAITSSIGGYCGLTFVRADEISHSGRITEDIWNKINKARFLIADLTGRNTNVFYELCPGSSGLREGPGLRTESKAIHGSR